jgi:two-component system, OmpR family, alkaline phosphatase synthesis response regulator PhoP
MTLALVITQTKDIKSELRNSLARYNVSTSFTSYYNGVREAVSSIRPDILLMEIIEQLPGPETWELLRKIKKEKKLKVIALVAESMLEIIELDPDVDDFIVAPYEPRELVLRIKRLVKITKQAENPEQIKSHGLVLDPVTCEVTVDGKFIELTFKEYELLKLLAGNRGRVFTREALLDNIWGYDYFGGDRTVDVHIRRLRSKIEDADHTYIETVRNIGYKFLKDS